MKRVFLKLLLGFLLATILPVLCLRWVAPPTTAFIMQRHLAGLVRGEKRAPTWYHWTDWSGISRWAALAVIASEDQKFVHHRGFDLESIRKAVQEREDGERIRGASTITQQVAKNLFLWPTRSFVRKGLEAYFTVLVELLWSKKRILEVYLNVVEFGDGVFGVYAAAETFFKEPPSELNKREAALLAAVLPNPKRFRADRPSAYVRRRAHWILGQMERLGAKQTWDELKG